MIYQLPVHGSYIFWAFKVVQRTLFLLLILADAKTGLIPLHSKLHAKRRSESSWARNRRPLAIQPFFIHNEKSQKLDACICLSVAVEKYRDCYKIELWNKNAKYTSKRWNSGVLQRLSSRQTGSVPFYIQGAKKAVTPEVATFILSDPILKQWISETFKYRNVRWFC